MNVDKLKVKTQTYNLLNSLMAKSKGIFYVKYVLESSWKLYLNVLRT